MQLPSNLTDEEYEAYNNKLSRILELNPDLQERFLSGDDELTDALMSFVYDKKTSADDFKIADTGSAWDNLSALSQIPEQSKGIFVPRASMSSESEVDLFDDDDIEADVSTSETEDDISVSEDVVSTPEEDEHSGEENWHSGADDIKFEPVEDHEVTADIAYIVSLLVSAEVEFPCYLSALKSLPDLYNYVKSYFVSLDSEFTLTDIDLNNLQRAINLDNIGLLSCQEHLYLTNWGIPFEKLSIASVDTMTSGSQEEGTLEPPQSSSPEMLLLGDSVDDIADEDNDNVAEVEGANLFGLLSSLVPKSIDDVYYEELVDPDMQEVPGYSDDEEEEPVEEEELDLSGLLDVADEEEDEEPEDEDEKPEDEDEAFPDFTLSDDFDEEDDDEEPEAVPDFTLSDDFDEEDDDEEPEEYSSEDEDDDDDWEEETEQFEEPEDEDEDYDTDGEEDETSEQSGVFLDDDFDLEDEDEEPEDEDAESEDEDFDFEYEGEETEDEDDEQLGSFTNADALAALSEYRVDIGDDEDEDFDSEDAGSEDEDGQFFESEDEDDEPEESEDDEDVQYFEQEDEDDEPEESEDDEDAQFFESDDDTEPEDEESSDEVDDMSIDSLTLDAPDTGDTSLDLYDELEDMMSGIDSDNSLSTNPLDMSGFGVSSFSGSSDMSDFGISSVSSTSADFGYTSSSSTELSHAPRDKNEAAADFVLSLYNMLAKAPSIAKRVFKNMFTSEGEDTDGK